MRIHRLFGQAICGHALIAGCATERQMPPSQAPSTLPDPNIHQTIVGDWTLERIGTIAIAPKRVTVSFRADGTFSAEIACQEYVSSFVIDASNVVALGPLRHTEKECTTRLENEALIEQAVVAGPWQAQVAGDLLTLSGSRVLSLSRV